MRSGSTPHQSHLRGKSSGLQRNWFSLNWYTDSPYLPWTSGSRYFPSRCLRARKLEGVVLGLLTRAQRCIVTEFPREKYFPIKKNVKFISSNSSLKSLIIILPEEHFRKKFLTKQSLISHYKQMYNVFINFIAFINKYLYIHLLISSVNSSKFFDL